MTKSTEVLEAWRHQRRQERTMFLIETLQKNGCTDLQVAHIVTTLRRHRLSAGLYVSVDFTPDSAWADR
jgi:hypothetical protein